MVLFYALGAGWGHLNRAMALCSAWPPGDVLRVLTDSTYHTHVALPGVEVVYMPSILDAINAVSKLGPADVLVVDTFPRGISSELTATIPMCPAKRVLIARNIVNYDETMPKNVDTTAFLAFYDLILLPEIGEPWVVCPTGKATSSASIIVIASGMREEIGWYGEVCRLLDAQDYLLLASSLPPGADPKRHVHYWPGIDYVMQASVVIGSGGYNTIAECRWAAVPLICKPWARRYDNQASRARSWPWATIVRTASDAVFEAGAALGIGGLVPMDTSNGIFDAVRRIVELKEGV